MPDKNEPDDKGAAPRRFISEKIVRQPSTKREIMRRAAALLFTAALFGIIAAVTFAASMPLAEKYLGKETIRETIPVTIHKDDPDTTAAEETSVAEAATRESEQIEDMLESAMKKYPFSADDLNALYANIRSIALNADKGIVAVHSVKTQTDWFNNPVENYGLYAGVVTALTDEELLVLTPEGAVEAADSIRVAFSDGTEVQGAIKQTDKLSGMAMVSVPASELGSVALEEILAVELGNSYSVKQGDLIIAIGGPAGLVHSTSYGFISYIAKNVQMTDGMTRVIYSDLRSNSGTGTFLINISGQIIGWVTDEYKNESSADMTAARAISDYKSILEKMSNGNAVPYFGIKGQEVSEAMSEKGMPLGVYVADVNTDGPAYNAGIQCGDIITQMGGESIATMKDFQVKLEASLPGEVLSATVLRSGRDEYKEIEYQVSIGAR